MSGCCDPSGYPGAFNRKTAERSARSYARRGLDSTARPMVDALAGAGLAGASVIDVGSGSGTALVSMFERGAGSAVGVDLSPNYEDVARRLMADQGLTPHVSWRIGDFVDLADELPRSDVVFLNRVVCCYPFADAMVTAVADRATRLIAMSYPRDRLVVRAFMRIANWWLRLSRSTFRVFVHDANALRAPIEGAGFERVAGGRTPAWEWNVWEKPAERPA